MELKLLITTFPHLFKRKNHHNRAALKKLQRLGFPMHKIRRALLELNDLNIILLADRKVSGPTIYGTISGDKINIKAQRIIAKSLDLTREELFPPIESPRI